MQGTLNEIDIRSILQLIELGQRTGELLLETYSSNSNHKSGDTLSKGYALQTSSTISRQAYARAFGSSHQKSPMKHQGHFWLVFFVNGQIVYAADSDSSLLRLRDYLRRYKAHGVLDQLEGKSIAATNAPEYGCLWALLERHVITPKQGRNILKGMVNETLFDLLSLHNGYFVFEISQALAPQLMTLEIAPLVTKIIKQVQEWKQFYPHIQSPHHCPVITDEAHLRTTLPENLFRTLARWVDGHSSLRQISRYLNRDLLTVARAIYPYVQKGWIQISTAQAPDSLATKLGKESKTPKRVPRVVCVDDDLAIGKTVESTLEAKGYEIKAIQDPLKALTLVFELQPDLILCDLVMPKLDGYEFCGMLRQSKAFRQTPIIMLTGKDGFIDRVRAKMVGSTDYLTKPFGMNELLMLLELYIGPGNLEFCQEESSLNQAIGRNGYR
ncbi:MAG: response regulator [Symploca sp. SIO3C6]|nr:response regulator [Symploca sp. SIO3C6]